MVFHGLLVFNFLRVFNGIKIFNGNMIFNSLKIFNGSILSRSSIVWRDKKSKSILNIFTLYFSEIYIHLINLHKNGLTFSLVKFWNKCLQKLIDHFHFVLFWNIFTDYTHCWEKYRKGKASSNKNSQCLRVFWNGDINYLFRCSNVSRSAPYELMWTSSHIYYLMVMPTASAFIAAVVVSPQLQDILKK